MELEKANDLAHKWKLKNEICTHPYIEIETNLGVKTGDRVCTTCGENFYPGKEESEANSKKPN